MVVSTATYISDTIKFLRDDLSSNITDPISASRTGRERFVMTSYALRDVKFPIISIRHKGSPLPTRLGMQSELHYVPILIEVKIRARNEIERDSLTQQVINRIRDNEFGASSSTVNELHDMEILSNQPSDIQDDASKGTGVVKAQVIMIQYKFVLGS